MNSTKTISIILCQILILSVIAFAQSTPPENPTFTPESFEKEIQELIKQSDSAKLIDDKISTIIGDSAKIKDMLTYVKDKIRTSISAKLITERIISKKAGRDLSFTIGEKGAIEDMSLSEADKKDPNLNIKVKGKSYEIPLNKLPKAITGVEVMENGVAYTTKNNGRVEFNDPKYTLTEENDKLTIGKYTGIDGQEHKFEISFNEIGKITIEENGRIRLSGGATIFDPATKTSFKLKDSKGTPGYVNFYKEGHIVKTIGNNIIVGKEDGLNLDIKTTNENGMFIISSNGITKESFNDYPPNIDKANSFLIDPEKKHIYIPEDKNAIGYVIDDKNGYQLFGIPNLPQGGVLLNGSAGFGGGNILGDGKGGTSVGGKGDAGGDAAGGNDGGIFGGGAINSILPFLLIGAAALAALLLLGGGDKDDNDNNKNKSNEENKSNEDDTSYNEELVSTGRSATPKTPTVQSIYDK